MNVITGRLEWLIFKKILTGVELKPDFNPDRLKLNEQYGFLEVPFEVPEGELARDGLLRFVGFGVGLNPGQGLDRSDQGEGVFVPRVEPEVGEIPRNPLERLKWADGVGKGLGPRLYSTPHAAHGFPRLQEALGVYTFNIDPQKYMILAAEGAVHCGRLVAISSGLLMAYGRPKIC